MMQNYIFAILNLYLSLRILKMHELHPFFLGSCDICAVGTDTMLPHKFDSHIIRQLSSTYFISWDFYSSTTFMVINTCGSLYARHPVYLVCEKPVHIVV